MAVTFTSHGYDTTTGNPYTEIAWAEAHPPIGASTYGVAGGSDWKVTAVTGADRTVSIAAGFGWGHGVTDETTANETIQLDTVTSGSRWDLIVVRRDWTPTAGESVFMKINGGSVKAIPGGRLSGAGAIDDQPLALVQVTAGQTQPTSIVDLRCWARNGGVVAKDDIVKGYLNDLGTELYINGIEWRYIPGTNDVPEWVATNNATTFAPLPVAGYSLTGTISTEQAGLKRRVVADINVTRTGAAGSIPKDDWASFGAILPTAVRGDSDPKYVPVSVIGGATSTAITNAHATAFLNPSNGIMQIRGVNTFTWNTGALFSLNLTYYI
jgi:hypothetical protein